MAITLMHTTHRMHVESIRQHGLLASCSFHLPRRIWLHRPNHWAWALIHTMILHDVQFRDLVQFKIAPGCVPIHRHGVRLFWTSHDIPPACLELVHEASDPWSLGFGDYLSPADMEAEGRFPR